MVGGGGVCGVVSYGAGQVMSLPAEGEQMNMGELMVREGEGEGREWSKQIRCGK